MPAPESLGLFRLGEEEEASASEEEEEESDEESEEEGSSKGGLGPRDGQVGTVGEEDGEDHEMETDAVPPAETVPVEPEPAVNGVKRRLEEDDNYDAD